ncbi:hypothetical protein NDN08_005539 [Rhodosorus marinus]|uniref:Uncharacterized protein n=1 Tax=Rhodosorus marinus TaxID=101924 RepID=A0AAV8V1V6_9RHOD|nr:hypothetical protein NDN08_005539 [Rhodosorus marinus]
MRVEKHSDEGKMVLVRGGRAKDVGERMLVCCLVETLKMSTSAMGTCSCGGRGHSHHGGNGPVRQQGRNGTGFRALWSNMKAVHADRMAHVRALNQERMRWLEERTMQMQGVEAEERWSEERAYAESEAVKLHKVVSRASDAPWFSDASSTPTSHQCLHQSCSCSHSVGMATN